MDKINQKTNIQQPQCMFNYQSCGEENFTKYDAPIGSSVKCRNEHIQLQEYENGVGHSM